MSFSYQADDIDPRKVGDHCIMGDQDLIIIENNIPLTTSYKIADELGIKHRSLMQLIKDHKDIIEKHFGVLRFENAKPLQGSSGGRPEQFVILTENQANYVLMLSGNTEQSMEVKALFVKAFAEAKEGLAYHKQQDHINEVHRMIRDYNVWRTEKLRFTVEEKANSLALSGVLNGLGFAANAFLDSSLAKAFKPWCREQGYDMSLVRETEKARIVMYELNEDRMTYNLEKPIKRHPDSYPEDPFGLAWSIFLVEFYWPERFLPYIKNKYKGEERAKNEEGGMKVISFFTGLTHKQITEKSKRGNK